MSESGGATIRVTVVSARSLAKAPRLYVKVRVGEQRGNNGSKTARVASSNGSAVWNASFDFAHVLVEQDLVALELKSAPNAYQNLKQSFATSSPLPGNSVAKPSIAATCFVPLTSLKATDRHEDWWPLAPNGKSHHTTSGEILVRVERLSPADGELFPPPSPIDSDVASLSPDERGSPSDFSTSSGSATIARRRVTFQRSAFAESAPLPPVPESPPAAAAATQAAAPDTRPLTAAQWRSTSLPPQITVEDATAPAIATVSSSSSSLLLSADDIVEPTDDNPYGARKLRRGSDSLLSSAAGKRHGRAKSDGMIVAAALPGGARADENSEQVELSATTAELFEDSSMPPDSSSSSSGSHVAAAAAATTTSAAAASPAPASPTAPAATCSRLLKNFVSNRTAKQRAKVHGFRKLFHLPESEELLVDWQASIVKNGLCFAGRMYVGTTVITFASNIFGIKTRECIPACDVLSVMRSGAQFGVGGVIQLTTGSGGKYRFVLMGIAGIAGDLGILRSVVAGDIDGALRLVIGGEGAPDAAEETIADDVHEHEQSLVLAQSIADADADARYLSASGAPPPPPLLLGAAAERVSVIQQRFDGVSVVRFFDMLFGDDSPIFAAYRQARGDVDVVLTLWDTATGRRQLTCRSPVKAPMGPSSTKVDEVQQYHLTPQLLELAMQVTAHDVPYGSYFVSEALWTVVPAADGGGGVDVSVRVGVHFRKWTMLRNKIQSACVSELTVSYEMLLQLARQHSTRSLSDVAMEQVGADRTPAVAAAAAAAVAVSNSTPQAQLSMREFGSNLLRQLQAHDVVLAAMCGVGLLLLWILWRIEGHLATIATQCIDVRRGNV